MKAAMDVITGGRFELLYRPILLHVVYDFLRGAPYGFLILILWNIFSPAVDTSKITLLIAGMVVTYAVQYIFGLTALTAVFESGYSLCSEARLNLGEHLRKLPMGFFKGRDSGDITALMLADMAMVEQLFTHIIGDVVAAFTIPAVLALFLFVLDWRLAAVAVMTVLVSLPFLWLSQVLIRRFGTVLQDARIEAGSRLLEYLQGIRYLKAYNLTGKRFRTLESSLENLHRAAIRIEVFPGAISSCYMSVLGIGYVVLVLAATYCYLGGTLSVPVYLVFLVLGYQFYQPLMQAVLSVMEARFMNLAAERMKEVM
ncbi:MAG TPA: ABC transporter ATP-binding protein, partial [Methanoregula sp.]|nr:ABC transporter ATP-binding protein [Methanoregula sp.]